MVVAVVNDPSGALFDLADIDQHSGNRIGLTGKNKVSDVIASRAVECAALFGEESSALYGTGRNYVAYFVFTGQPDPVTGMLINISEIKERAGRIIHDRYDHRFLNEDNPAFRD